MIYIGNVKSVLIENFLLIFINYIENKLYSELMISAEWKENNQG